jgi:zinc/manganese transport system substrate-binding protein
MTRKNLVLRFIPSHQLISRALRGFVAGGLTIMLGLAAVGCANSSDSSGTDTAASDCTNNPVVVVSTLRNWDALVGEIMPPCVAHSAILASADAEPHDFEPTSSDIATLTVADVVIVNGGHLDEWAMDALANSPEVKVIEVSTLVTSADSEEDSAHSEEGGHSHENSHYWFGLNYIEGLKSRLTQELDAIYAERGFTERVDLSAIDAKIAQARELIATVGDAIIPAAATEAILDYLLVDAGVENLTPEEYVHAGYHETEPTAQDIADFLQLFTESKVQLLIYNSTEEDDVTKQILTRAEESVYSGNNQPVRVLDVTEMLPEGQSSLIDWWISIFEQVRAV